MLCCTYLRFSFCASTRSTQWTLELTFVDAPSTVDIFFCWGSAWTQNSPSRSKEVVSSPEGSLGLVSFFQTISTLFFFGSSFQRFFDLVLFFFVCCSSFSFLSSDIMILFCDFNTKNEAPFKKSLLLRLDGLLE